MEAPPQSPQQRSDVQAAPRPGPAAAPGRACLRGAAAASGLTGTSLRARAPEPAASEANGPRSNVQLLETQQQWEQTEKQNRTDTKRPAPRWRSRDSSAEGLGASSPRTSKVRKLRGKSLERSLCILSAFLERTSRRSSPRPGPPEPASPPSALAGEDGPGAGRWRGNRGFGGAAARPAAGGPAPRTQTRARLQPP